MRFHCLDSARFRLPIRLAGDYTLPVPHTPLPALLLTLLLLHPPGASLQAAPPNLLFILTDDLGIGDVSAYRQADVQTPHLDRLAREGLRFTAMRANATVCSPTRAAILTGRHPDRVGVPGVIRTHPHDSWGWFDPSIPTIADHLRQAGYHTALVGKWHLGLESPNTPNQRGFDHFHGFLGDMMDSYTRHLRHDRHYLRLNADPIHPVGHATDLFTRWAIDHIETRARSRDTPFFLFLSYNAPHFPIEPPRDWLDRIRQRDPGLDQRRARNVAFVEHLDHGIGQVLDALRRTGLDQTTLVIFTSDNGGSLPHAQNNDPWRDGKQSHYDGGLRVPFLARWPGTIEPGTLCNDPALTFDVFPTFLELAGHPLPDDLDAASLLPAFRGQPLPAGREFYFVRREGGRYGGMSYHALLRDGWKLVQNDPFSPLELYDLASDPREERNLAAAHPDRLQALLAALRIHIQRGGVAPWQPPP